MAPTQQCWATWPTDAAALRAVQVALAAAALQVEPYVGGGADALVGGCFVCFDTADRAFAAAVTLSGPRIVAAARASGVAAHPYEPGLLALREGAVLEQAVRGLRARPDVLLVNGTGIDHPRRAGLAVHLGAVLCLPTVGVTHRPLHAHGRWPADAGGAVSPLVDDSGATVGAWTRTCVGRRPVAVHAGWRTSVDRAVDVVIGQVGRVRTPEPLRRARELARRARAERQPAG